MHMLQKGVVALVTVGAFTLVSATQFEITPTVGKRISGKDTTLDDKKVLMGIRGTAYVTPNVGIQAVAESSQNNPTIGGGDTDIERGSLNVIYEGGTQKIRPYALVGAGYEWTHGNTVKLTDDDSQPFYNAGVGVKFGINDKLDLVTEVKGMHKAENGDNDLIGTVGLGMKVGGVVQKKPKCATKKVLTLEEFSKMCQAPKIAAPSPMPAETVTVEKMQTEPAVVVEKSAEPVEVEGPVVMEKPAASESTGIPEGYYVQLAALFKSSGDILIRKLERKNYPYVIHTTKRGGKDVTLILAGPYQSRKEAVIAKRYLKRVSHGAFVKKFPHS